MTAAYLMPASFAQQRLWLLDRLLPGVPIYNLAQTYRLTGPLDAAVFQRSLDEIERRHEVLRTVLVEREGGPMQAISEPRGAAVETEDVSGLDVPARADVVSRAAVDEASRPFDLAGGPLWRARLLRVADTEHVLLVTMHHAITDHWSMRIFMDELVALYDAFSTGLGSPLPELPVQYADFAEWQRDWLLGSRLTTQLEFWRARLADAPPGVELPADRPRPPVRDYLGGRCELRLPAALAEDLRQLSRRTGTTLYMTLLAAFQVLLHRYTGQTDVVIGSPVANRVRVQLEPLIGFFVNLLVLRGDLRGHPSFERVLGRTREQALGAYANQDLPFERVVEELQPPRSLNRHPFFQVTFQLIGRPAGGRRTGPLRVTSYEPSTVFSRFDLDLTMWEAPDGLRGIAVYALELFDPGTVRELLRCFETLLEAAVAAPDLPVDRLRLVEPRLRRIAAGEGERTGMHVLDEHLEPVPDGVAGELCLAGPALAAGGLGDAAATALVYVPDPFGPEGSRLLRTGNLARRRGGALEDLGPIAHQVWSRGQRLELREMERALEAHPAVRRALLRASGDRLVAYYVPAPGATPDPAELRLVLRGTQPEHAVPAAWVPLDALPVTADGRIDHRALPEPPPADAGDAPGEAALTPVEALVAQAWRERFGASRVGAESSFFRLGGHSLLAMQEAALLGDRFGVELTLRDLFADPTVRGVGRAIERLVREQVEALSEEAAGAALAGDG